MGTSAWKDEGEDEGETLGPGLRDTLSSARWTDATTWKRGVHSEGLIMWASSRHAAGLGSQLWLCVLWHVTHLAMPCFSHLQDRDDDGTHLTELKWRLSECQ